MALKKLKQPRTEPPETDPEFLSHLARLGLSSHDQYRAWCERHGFARRIEKTPLQREQERLVVAREAADARLAKRKNTDRRPDRVIEAVFTGDVEATGPGSPLSEAIERAACSPGESGETKDAARRLFVQLCRHTELVSTRPVVAALGMQPGNTYVEAVAALARRSNDWIRGPESWIPRTHNARRQFASLARHLLTDWPVPAFLDAAWFLGRNDEATRRQGWFLRIGRGENIRHADLPMPYTKKMAHHFLEAPTDLSIDASLRWGQVRALGGDERLIRALVGTRLEREFEHDDFWTSVLRWFIAHPLLAKDQVGPIIDFIHHQKFVPTDAVVAGELHRADPPQPNFSMKDRAPETLLRQVARWHSKLARTDQAPAEWTASGITPFRFVEGSDDSPKQRIWTIRELLSSRALSIEGRAMHHCVGSYTRSCAAGSSSIWALEVYEQGAVRKLATIEIASARRTICQVRGRCNALPDERVRGLLRRWAAEAGLSTRGI